MRAMTSESVILQRTSALDALFKGYQGPAFTIRLWDGWEWRSPSAGEAVCTIVLHSPEALETLTERASEITLGEAFLSKKIDVEGDLFCAIDIVEYAFQRPRGQLQRVYETMTGVLSGINEWRKAGRMHSEERDKASISYHYDQSADFYRPWLGPSLAYSSAYFQSDSDSVDAAQANKLDLICRKLRLQPGERFLDVGCGWGSLVLHAASRYGVHASGITLSHEQEAVAADRVGKALLTQSCDIELLDYRKALERFPLFDKIASVGMFEHVGLKNLPLYFRTVFNLLKPGGVFLNSGITRAPISRCGGKSFLNTAIVPFLRNVLHISRPHGSSFIDRHVFPDSELVTLPQVLQTAEGAGFEIRDVESLREHYEMTLRGWVKELQRNADQLLAHVSEKTYRIWLLYMAGSAAAFRRGDISVYQVLLSRADESGNSHLPLTREDWYKPVSPDGRMVAA